MKTHTKDLVGKHIRFRTSIQHAAETSFLAVTTARDNPLTHRKRNRITRLLPR